MRGGTHSKKKADVNTSLVNADQVGGEVGESTGQRWISGSVQQNAGTGQ